MLKARFVIHTVGPVWRGGNIHEDELLANSYNNSLRLAASKFVDSIAFPNISTGVYGFPKKQAAEIAVREVRLFLCGVHHTIKTVIFCCFDEENHQTYQALLG